jgi:hypothetical protein
MVVGRAEHQVATPVKFAFRPPTTRRIRNERGSSKKANPS